MIDDNPVNLRMGAKVLKALGHQGFLLSNAAEALVLLTEQPVDLILLDTHMPQMDGYAFLQQLRTHSKFRLRSLPVIMLSAFEAQSEASRAQAAGANAYVEKPLTEPKLNQAILALGV